MPGNHSINGVAHFDICGPDLNALKHFYERVFGWSAESAGPGYALIKTPDGSPDGALVETLSASLTIGVVVADLAGALDAVLSVGGDVTMPATDNGWVTKAQVSDPAGNVVTLVQG